MPSCSTSPTATAVTQKSVDHLCLTACIRGAASAAQLQAVCMYDYPVVAVMWRGRAGQDVYGTWLEVYICTTCMHVPVAVSEVCLPL